MNLYESFRTRWNLTDLFLHDLRAGRKFTYADLDEMTARLAWQLRSRFGIRPGDRIAAQVEKTPEAFFLYLACLRAGAIYLPLNPAYQPAEIDYFLKDAEPSLVVRDLAPILEGVESQPSTFDTARREDSDVAAILYTSGTTGRSKGAMITHANLFSNAQALSSAWGFTREDRLLHTLPIFHVHGLFISLHCILNVGAGALWLPKFDASEVLSNLEKCTVFMGVPTYYTRLLESPALNEKICKDVRLFVSGSAPLRAETFEAFESRTGHRILERYGMTETGINTSNSLTGSRIAGTVGAPLPGIKIRLGEDGEIEVRGPNVFPGYWRQPELSRKEFHADGFFKTGDIGEWDPSGYLKIVGRAKDLVISGGFNVYPKEIELVLDEMDGVEESAVFGVPHSDFGEAVVAAVVRSDSDAGISLEESKIISATKSRLASFKVPKKIVFLEALPRNTMGKVQKNLLRTQFSTLFLL